MKLSEAIRLGSLIRPQGFGALFYNLKSCAWGAALEAVGCDLTRPIPWPNGLCITSSWDQFGWTEEAKKTCGHCPVCGFDDLYSKIVHLNDEHRWTREQIADWIDSLTNDKEEELYAQPSRNDPDVVHQETPLDAGVAG